MKLERRHFLRMAGAGGLASLLASLGGARTGAAAPGAPRRVVFFYSNHGFKQFNDDGSLKQLWSPTAPGAPDALSLQAPWSTTSHTLLGSQSPLDPIKGRISFLDGLDMISNNVDPTGAANAHYAGETHALTGTNRLTGELAGGPSIDQFIAQGINTPAPVTALRSLELGVGGNYFQEGGGAENHPFYSGAGEVVPFSYDPAKIYDRIFPNGPPAQGEDPALQKRVAQQQAVLRHVADAYGARASGLPSRDKTRLEAHRDAVADLERRIGLTPTVTCTPLDRAVTDGRSAADDVAAYETNADLMARLVTTALSCDVTRVVSMCVNDPPDEAFGYQSIQGTTDWHDMVHKVNGTSGNALINDPGAIEIANAYQRYMNGTFARLVTMLDQQPDVDGTLLDNTLVVWCVQIAGGDHSLDRIPFVVAGGLGGAVTPGRYVRYPRVAAQDRWPQYSDGPAHNDLYLAIAQAMGVQADSFGNPAVCKGPLAGLVG